MTATVVIALLLPYPAGASATRRVNGSNDGLRPPPGIDRTKSPTDGYGAAVAIDGDTAIIGAPENDGDGYDAGAAYVYVRSEDDWVLQARLSAPDSNDVQGFGLAVALQGDTAVIGAPRDERIGADAGVAYVFVRDAGSWSLQALLQPSEVSAGDRFGTSVGLDGATAIVGAPGADSPQPNAGAAFVFERSGTTWAEQARLTSGQGHARDAFGSSGAISGDAAVIGAPRGDTPTEADTGIAEVFVRSGSNWAEETVLAAATPTPGDRFGGAVALDRDTAVIGASRTADGQVDDVGTAYVFVGAGAEWSPQAILRDPSREEGDRFGFAVAVDGDEAVVGSPGASPLTDEQGSAFLFKRAESVWVEDDDVRCINSSRVHAGRSVSIHGQEALVGEPSRGSFPGPTGRACAFEPIEGSGWHATETFASPHDHYSDEMGSAVAIQANTAVVGAPDDESLLANGGAAYVYTRTDEGWAFQAKLLPPLGGPGGIPYSEFGASVAIDGDTIVVGAPRHLAGPIPTQGSVHIFVRDGNAWSHQATLLDPETGNYDAFGNSLAVQDDTLLVGVPGYSVANVFVRDGEMWSLQATLSDPNGEDEDMGSSVALDHDTAIIGADTSGIAAGEAHVFVREGTTWSFQATVWASDGNPHGRFGAAAALVGDTAVIGAPGDGSFDAGPGHAFVYEREGSLWFSKATLEDPDPSGYESFGTSVAFDGDFVLVGAKGKWPFEERYAGAAFMFVRSGESWSLLQMLIAPDRAQDDYFGNAVAFSGDNAFVGSEGDELPTGHDAGSAYVFERSGRFWVCHRKFMPRPVFE